MITIMTILLYLSQNLVPDFAAVVARVEIQSTIFAVTLFAFLLTRLWLDSRGQVKHSVREHSG
jgi:hypothetical protein